MEPGSPQLKALLRSNTDTAAVHGVFGVSAFEVGGKLFWGIDGLPMLRAWLEADAWFDEECEASARVANGVAS